MDALIRVLSRWRAYLVHSPAALMRVDKLFDTSKFPSNLEVKEKKSFPASSPRDEWEEEITGFELSDVA
jgi:hypothetical protein